MWWGGGTQRAPASPSYSDRGDGAGGGETPYTPASYAGSLNDEEGDGWLSDAVGSDYDYSDYGSENGDLEENALSSPKKRGHFNPDIEFQGEWLYEIVKMVRGQTPGRQLKRTIFQLAVLLMVCTFPLMVMAYIEDRTFEVGHYFTVSSPAGAALQPLMWLTGAPGFVLGFGSLYIIKYWASLCTNRLLLGNISRVYMAVVAAYFVIVVYTVVVLFLTFSPVKRWGDTLLLVRIFPFYLCSCIFIVPLAAGILLLLLDISHFVDEITNVPGSSIDEPDPPADVMDLSDVTATQLVLVVLSTPFVIFVQIFDLCMALWRAVGRLLSRWRRKRAEEATAGQGDAELAAKKKRSGFFVRLWRTLRRVFLRCFCCFSRKQLVASPGKTLPITAGAGSSSSSEAEEKSQELRGTTGLRDRELEERLARERAEEEAERRRQRDLRDAAEREAAEAARRQREAEIVAAREAKELQEMRDKERLRMAPTLDVPTFKDKWSVLPAAGTFSCRVRTLPELKSLTDHFRTQGFHIVFASVPSPAEVEVGICNVRERGVEPWFLARFLSSKGTFTAVMKSENAEAAPAFVKKFALAKVLKIDASSVPRSPKQSANTAHVSGTSVTD